MFKGSSQPDINIFYPEDVVADDVGKLNHAGIDAEKVVWVADKANYALPFAMLMGKVKFSLFYKNGEKPKISIKTIEPQKILDLDQVFYLYELEDANYTKVLGPEYISLEPVAVKKITEHTMREIFHDFDVYVPTKWDI